MLAIKFILRPARFLLHFDRQPDASPQWKCACSLAECTHTGAPTAVFGRKLTRVQHQSDVLRLEILDKQGGLYFDHDAFVVRHNAMHSFRSCHAQLIAGHQAYIRRTIGHAVLYSTSLMPRTDV